MGAIGGQGVAIRLLAALAVLAAGMFVLAAGMLTFSVAEAQSGSPEFRISARRLADGRVEFALQTRAGRSWSERVLPSRRYFPTSSQGEWLYSSEVVADGATVRISARRLTDGRIEFALRREVALAEGLELRLGGARFGAEVDGHAAFRQVGPSDPGRAHAEVVLYQRAEVVVPAAPVRERLLVGVADAFEEARVFVLRPPLTQPAPVRLDQRRVRPADRGPGRLLFGARLPVHCRDAQDADTLAVVAAEVAGPAHFVAVHAAVARYGGPQRFALRAMPIRAVDHGPCVVQPALLGLVLHR